ncbi:MAG: hypothetical protein AAGD92_01985 [Pseudomonadota bacterium]
MTSGRDILHRIDGAIAKARASYGDANGAAAERASRMAVIERAEADAYSRIASIRIDHLKTDELTRSLGRIDEQALKLIETHEDHIDALAVQLVEARGVIERLEGERRKGEEALEKALADHDRAVGKTNERLEKDEEYQRRAQALEQANAVAERAEAKLELARNDREEKGAPYEADPLFSYLWKRKFGTKEYKAFFLFAALDRWVAGLIKYRDARLNYARLLELPDRLEEHADRVEAAAEEIEVSIEAYEREALERDGVGKLRDKAKTARGELEKTDAAIADAEAHHQKIAAEHAAAASGRSGPLHDARGLMSKALADRSIPDLKVLAAETLTLEDDRLVDELIRLRREKMEIEESARSVAQNLGEQEGILRELETLRRKFKSARYDSPYSEFPDRSVIGVVLSELLRGAMREDEAWRRVRKAQRRRKRDWSDDFGGPEWRDGFGLPKNNRTWGNRSSGAPKVRFPRAPRAPRRPRAPRPPRIRTPRSRGGFKTGGGF